MVVPVTLLPGTTTTSSGTTSTNSVSCPVPAGAPLGSLLVACASWTSAATPTPGAGWTLRATATLSTTDTATIWTRPVTGTETVFTLALTGFTAWCASVTVIVGAAPTPVDATRTATGVTTSPTLTTWTTPTPDGIVYAMTSGRGAADGTIPTVTAWPAGWTPDAAVTTVRTGTNRNNTHATAILEPASTTIPTATWTISQTIGSASAAIHIPPATPRTGAVTTSTTQTPTITPATTPTPQMRPT